MVRKCSTGSSDSKRTGAGLVKCGIGDVILLLPTLAVDADGRIDLSVSQPATLAALAEGAEITAGAMNRGLSALGALIAYSAPELEDGTLGSDTIEALGWLLAELGALNAACIDLSMRCRMAGGTGKGVAK